MRFEVETKASPEQVRRALTDFSDRRLETWSRTLDPARYELRDQGETWAVAKEATPRSPFWVVAHYDWSDPDLITMSVRESSYGGGGDGLVRIHPRPGGGSLLAVEWDNTDAAGLWQRVLLVAMHKGPMGRVVSRLWASSLDRFADADGHAGQG